MEAGLTRKKRENRRRRSRVREAEQVVKDKQGGGGHGLSCGLEKEREIYYYVLLPLLPESGLALEFLLRICLSVLVVRESHLRS